MTIFGRFKSIRDAMMLSFSVLVVVAVLIFLLIAMNFTKKTIYENSRTSTSQLISQVNYDIDSYIDYMENISWVAASGSDLSRYLFNQEQTPDEKEAAKARILTQFTTILESRSDIYNVAAVADNGEALINSGADRLNKYVDVRAAELVSGGDPFTDRDRGVIFSCAECDRRQLSLGDHLKPCDCE